MKNSHRAELARPGAPSIVPGLGLTSQRITYTPANAMDGRALTEWKRMKAIELRLRSTTLQEELNRLQAELHEATAEFASAFTLQAAKRPATSV